MKDAMKLTGTHLCRMDGKGRPVILKSRKTWAAGKKLAEQATLTSREFAVRSYVVVDDTASDHGTVYWFDANGEMIEPPVNA